MDFEDIWMGVVCREAVPTKNAMVALKVEYGAACHTICGLKCEQMAVSITNKSKWDKDAAARMETEGGKFTSGALRKWAGGLLGFGL